MLKKKHNHHQNCFHHHHSRKKWTEDCLTGRLDNFGSCLKLSIAEEPSLCSAEQLLFSPFLSSISWRLFSKAIINHLQQLGTSVWSHRSPCGLRKISFELELSLAFLYSLLFLLTILFLQCDVYKQGKVQILPVRSNDAVILLFWMPNSSFTTIEKTNLSILWCLSAFSMA